jgi:hypothetical protein
MGTSCPRSSFSGVIDTAFRAILNNCRTRTRANRPFASPTGYCPGAVTLGEQANVVVAVMRESQLGAGATWQLTSPEPTPLDRPDIAMLPGGALGKAGSSRTDLKAGERPVPCDR